MEQNNQLLDRIQELEEKNSMILGKLKRVESITMHLEVLLCELLNRDTVVDNQGRFQATLKKSNRTNFTPQFIPRQKPTKREKHNPTLFDELDMPF